MKTILFWFLFGFSTLYAWVDKGIYIKKLKTLPPISYHDLCQKYIKPHPLFEKNKDIEDEFISWDADSNLTAIDFEQLGVDSLIKISPKYTVVFYNHDDFCKYAILLDSDMKIQSILLLAYRKGTSEWQLERDVVIKPDRDTLFWVYEQYRGTEWLISQVKGSMIVEETRAYSVNIKDEKHFDIKPSSYKQRYKQVDKKLNQHYSYLMKHLDKSSKNRLRKTQRAWLKYISLKCNYMMKNILYMPEDSIHFKNYKNSCLYEEVKRRDDELKSIVNYIRFYQ